MASLTATVLGTPTVSTHLESGAGIATGGKAGFVSLVVAATVLLSNFLAPIIAFIPSAASRAALIRVGS
jgi:AGZA family xanthine/uracil permease-like MFS transporter